jgi:deoxycytidylate deaminase
MHHGSIRELNFSPMNDLNFYDTIHAEVQMIINGQRNKLDFKDTILFINLLCCPNCAKVICETDIIEVVYKIDHSDGFAIKILNEAGKKVRRII